ncbi:MAG TPA: RNA 3'-terminal phosphate cyclase [Xanthobacteraceae bacterium]
MDVLTLDGSQGEGGGQILRTALALSIITVRQIRLVNIRAKRRNPGLLPQHLSAVRAAAAISGAAVSGDRLRSTEITFAPSHSAKSGSYVFDVAETAGRGSAGSVTLILQTLAIPLLLAAGSSTLILRGGTHVEWSPPFDDLAMSYFPLLRRIGYSIDAELMRWGWYPVGGGEVTCRIARAQAACKRWQPTPIEAMTPGPLQGIIGRAVAANLPAHIPQRMANRARISLAEFGIPVNIEPESIRAACAGAGIFFQAAYGNLPASFSAYGRMGRPSEVVADQAVAAFREHHLSGAAIELHLADQLLLPLALAAGPSTFTSARPTGHLRTNAWTIEQFEVARISIAQETPCRIRVQPLDWQQKMTSAI